VIQTLANLALIVAALGALTFVIAYQLIADWRATAIGRNVMAFMVVTSLLLTLGILRNIVPWLDGHIDEFRLVAYVLVASIIWQRVWLLFKVQRQNRKAGR
jgi:hypothetical protein